MHVCARACVFFLCFLRCVFGGVTNPISMVAHSWVFVFLYCVGIPCVYLFTLLAHKSSIFPVRDQGRRSGGSLCAQLTGRVASCVALSVQANTGKVMTVVYDADAKDMAITVDATGLTLAQQQQLDKKVGKVANRIRRAAGSCAWTVGGDAAVAAAAAAAANKGAGAGAGAGAGYKVHPRPVLSPTKGGAEFDGPISPNASAVASALARSTPKARPAAIPYTKTWLSATGTTTTEKDGAQSTTYRYNIPVRTSRHRALVEQLVKQWRMAHYGGCLCEGVHARVRMFLALTQPHTMQQTPKLISSHATRTRPSATSSSYSRTCNHGTFGLKSWSCCASF